MKTIILSMALIGLTCMQVFATEHGNKYCAKMMDGKMSVTHEGNTIKAEVTLSNGTRLQPDGTMIKKDGSKSMLKAGECVGPDGMVMMGKDMDKKGSSK